MNKRLIPAILISLITLGSCSKTARVTPDPAPIDSTLYYTYSMNSIYTSLKNVPKVVTIDNTTGGVVVGNSGTVYTFPGGLFQTISGGSVIGNVTVSLTEYVKKGDMIFSRVLPFSVDSQALISGGEVLVEATQGGGKLMIKPGMTYTAAIPQQGVLSPGMQFFYGQMVNTSVNPVSWTTGLGTGTASTLGDTVTLVSDSLGYVSAGKYFTSPSYQSFVLNVTGVTFNDSDHVQAYAVYDNYRAVYPMLNRYHQKFNENKVLNKPLHFVVYTVYHGDFYAGISSSSVTPQTGGTYTVNISKVNPITFLQTVNGL